ESRTRSHTGHRDPTAWEAINRLVAAINGNPPPPDPLWVQCDRCGATHRFYWLNPDNTHRPEGPKPPDWLDKLNNLPPRDQRAILDAQRLKLLAELAAFTKSAGELRWLDGRWRWADPVGWINRAIGPIYLIEGSHYIRSVHIAIGLPEACGGHWREI